MGSPQCRGPALAHPAYLLKAISVSLGKLTPSSPADAWDKKWADIFAHYQNDIRHGHYIRALLRDDERHVLEMGAGSFRDVAALNRWGWTGEGMDFSGAAVQRAKQQFAEYAALFHHMSAFDMPFADRSFDVTYHNGFWVLFSDEDIRALAKEQARVTQGRMIATVHNSHNHQFFDYFERMKQTDPLYDIRFFSVDEITQLMRTVCDDVVVIPVGKQKKRWEDWLIKQGLAHPLLLRQCLLRQGHALLDNSERLLCIGTVR